MKKIAILGLGKMGSSILKQIITVSEEFSKDFDIFVYDINKQREDEISLQFPNVKFIRKFDESLLMALKKIRPHVIINATTFYNNLYYTKIAIEVGSNYVDLGQNTWATLNQRTNDKLAKERKIRIVPETGLAPGTINIIASQFLKEGFDSVYMYTGGLPIDSRVGGILRYGFTWSIEGLIQEYTDVVAYIEDGTLKFKQGFSSEIEEIKIKFKDNEIYKRIVDLQKVENRGNYYYILDLEAIPTSDGASLMPFDYKCLNLEYKTIRYKGHYSAFKVLYDMGLFDEYKEVEGKNLKNLTIKILESIVPKVKEDVVYLKVIARSGKDVKEFNGIVLYDDDYTAMQKMTGFGAVISALGIIDELDVLDRDDYGVLMSYEIFDAKKYLSYLSEFVKFGEFNYE